ncbi:hypothetical protein F2P56_014656 [Juglans regia]|uniref:Reverse transcriptase Ty1/copia-type domain-containing protein n=1 Tax=Juglans regia TaxID=51240 RepID=A0A833XDA5_JUGRE|nr:hypothetical protein F2P56_014656 [Juglans regia]
MAQLGSTRPHMGCSIRGRVDEGRAPLPTHNVDDIVIGNSNLEVVDNMKAYLHSQFKIKNLGILKYFLGLEIARSAVSIHLCQRKYSLEILVDTGLLGCKSVNTPMEINHKLTHSSSGLLVDSTRYRRLNGRLIYLTITRPNITYAVNILIQFMDKLAKTHMHDAHRVLKYLKGSIG